MATDPASSTGSRRQFLKTAGGGFGLVALADLLRAPDASVFAASPGDTPQNAEALALAPLAPRPSHFPAKAKHVIWLFMNGGQSQVDTWDDKPELEKRDGQSLTGFDNKTGFFPDQVGGLMKSPFRFTRQGQSGTWTSEIFPHVARHVDDLAFIHSCYTATNNHSPALFQINTGMSRMGFPCVGSWVTYGLGTQSQNMPAFVVMYDTLGRGLPKGHSLNWGAGFLPGVFQGTALNPKGDPIDNLTRPPELKPAEQRAQLDLLKSLNESFQEQHSGEAELAARIESFELAYRMQMQAP
jgi:hypothetical protein